MGVHPIYEIYTKINFCKFQSWVRKTPKTFFTIAKNILGV